MSLSEIINLLCQVFIDKSRQNENYNLIVENYKKYNNIDNLDPSKIPNTYPFSPFIYQIAYQINQLFINKNILFPSISLNLLKEDYDNERLSTFEEVKTIVVDSIDQWNSGNDSVKLVILNRVIECLNWRGILDLLCIRKTTGSNDLLPIPREILLEEFQKIHSRSKCLSVGAKALTKHSNRDQSSKWWGEVSGSEEDKSKHALDKVNEIIDQAVWINIHQLPGQKDIIEIRNERGYGARWYYETHSFIGFIEPQVVQGWENNYKH